MSVNPSHGRPSAHILPLLSLLLALAGCTAPIQESAPDVRETAQTVRETFQEREPALAAGSVSIISETVARPAHPKDTPMAEPLPAMNVTEQPIEELVIKATGLTGYWRFSASRDVDVDVGILSGIRIRYGAEQIDRNICWVQQVDADTFTVYCAISGSPSREVHGTLSEDGLTFRSWIGPANLSYSGRFTDSDHVSGGFSGGILGVRLTGQIPATLSRLAGPMSSEPRSAALVRQAWGETDRDRGGTLVRLAYLGQILAPGQGRQTDAVQDVYQLDTQAGRWLCRIGLGNRGGVEDFACVPIPDLESSNDQRYR